MTLPDLDTMTKITEAELHARFDEILAAAEQGEFFVITCTTGSRLVLMPYDEFAQLVHQIDPKDEAAGGR